MLFDRMGEQASTAPGRCAAPHRAATRARTAAAMARPSADKRSGMRKGAAGSSSMLNASRITPGIAVGGATLPELKAPALPNEQPRPGSSRSISVTSAPRRSRCQAVHAPTMPAPTTTIAARPFPLISICVHHEGVRCHVRHQTRLPVVELTPEQRSQSAAHLREVRTGRGIQVPIRIVVHSSVLAMNACSRSRHPCKRRASAAPNAGAFGCAEDT